MPRAANIQSSPRNVYIPLRNVEPTTQDLSKVCSLVSVIISASIIKAPFQVISKLQSPRVELSRYFIRGVISLGRIGRKGI